MDSQKATCRCSESLAIKEMKLCRCSVSQAIRPWCKHLKLKIMSISNAGDDTKQMNLLYIAGGNTKITPILENASR